MGARVDHHEAFVGVRPLERLETFHDPSSCRKVLPGRRQYGILNEAWAGAKDNCVPVSLRQPRFDLAHLQVSDGVQIRESLLLQTRCLQEEDTHPEQGHDRQQTQDDDDQATQPRFG
ncbi:MAG: hypothetical protein JNL91_07660 [Candidatus Accumulibacter sp.]|nr:hypothetical protein [Accumulibacter sp.]